MFIERLHESRWSCPCHMRSTDTITSKVSLSVTTKHVVRPRNLSAASRTPVGAVEDAGDALRKEAQRASLQAGGDAVTVRRDAACRQEEVPHLRSATAQM